MSRLTRDGTAEPVSQDHIHRREWGQGSIYFPCSADHDQDSQPYAVDPYSAISDDHKCTQQRIFVLLFVSNENLRASTPSEHPPSQRGKGKGARGSFAYQTLSLLLYLPVLLLYKTLLIASACTVRVTHNTMKYNIQVLYRKTHALKRTKLCLVLFYCCTPAVLF